jgi:hypothetical protein
VNVTQWHGCYSGSWQGILVPDAFAHPAKVAPGLSYRIYRHMLDAGYIAPGDSVFDPFGGIGGFGYHAMLLGLHWTGVELEPRFVELGQRNIDKWRRDLAMLNGTLGTARLLQGDSRRLAEIVGAGAAASICSPPYETDALGHSRGQAGLERDKVYGTPPDTSYGSTPGQLGSMPSGDYGAVVSSPPYADNAATWVEGPGARHDPIHHNGDNAFKASSDSGYGSTPGNVGNMRDGGFEAAVSSPPFGGEAQHTGGPMPTKHYDGRQAPRVSSGMVTGAAPYGVSKGQLAQEDGDTFWAAARAIVEQTYAALRPGGYAAWVTKDFVRKGQRVPFSDQWQELCAAVGFESVERIHAMLVEEHGEQLDIFGNGHARRKERKSFFRRLAEKKGSPRIDHEDVLILRKPVTE